MEYVLRRQYSFFVRTLRGESTPKFNRSDATPPARAALTSAN